MQKYRNKRQKLFYTPIFFKGTIFYSQYDNIAWNPSKITVVLSKIFKKKI